jgi:hypothetical protein
MRISAHDWSAETLYLLCAQLRREKISERMKLLQDLVPGCSKVGIYIYIYFLRTERVVYFLSVHLVTYECNEALFLGTEFRLPGRQ